MQKNIHAGHRARLRNKFMKLGCEGLEEHELLELLLCYAIPQKNTNTIAHTLIDRFGSLKNVLEAAPSELCEISGIGEYAATLIRLQAGIAKVYYTSLPKKTRLTSVGQAAKYVVNQLYGRQTEGFYAFALDINLGLLSCKLLCEGGIDCVTVDPRKLASFLLDCNAAYVIIAHNHPNGLARSSYADIELTKRIVSAMKPLGIAVCDHIITSGKDFYSFNLQKHFSADSDETQLLAAQYSTPVTEQS